MFVSVYVPYMLLCGIAVQSLKTHAQGVVTSQREEGQEIPPSIENQEINEEISDTPLVTDPVGSYPDIVGINSGPGSIGYAALKFSRKHSKPVYPYVGNVQQYSLNDNSETKSNGILPKVRSDALDWTSNQSIKVKMQGGPEFTQTKDSLHVRTKRGFRSAVADRIAHGFGKRANALDLQDEQWQAVKALLDFSRFEQEVFDDDINTLVRLYRKYGNRTINQPLDSRHPMSENADAELMKKLLANMRDGETMKRSYDGEDFN